MFFNTNTNIIIALNVTILDSMVVINVILKLSIIDSPCRIIIFFDQYRYQYALENIINTVVQLQKYQVFNVQISVKKHHILWFFCLYFQFILNNN